MIVKQQTQYLLGAVFCALLVVSIVFPVIMLLTCTPLIILAAYFFVKKNYIYPCTMAIMLLNACIFSSGDFIYVFFSLFILGGALAVILALKIRFYQFGAAACALIALFSAAMPFAIAFAAQNTSAGSFTYNYIKSCADDENIIFSSSSQINALAKLYYILDDDGEADKMIVENEPLALRAEKWASEDLFYYLAAYSVAIGIFTYLVVFLLCQKNKIAVKTKNIAFCDMRLDFNFVKFVFLPVIAFSFLGYIPTLTAATTALLNAFVCVPYAFAAMSFFYHNLHLAEKPYQDILKGGFYILAALCLIFPLAAFIISFIGLADSILRLRRLIAFALRD